MHTHHATVRVESRRVDKGQPEKLLVRTNITVIVLHFRGKTCIASCSSLFDSSINSIFGSSFEPSFRNLTQRPPHSIACRCGGNSFLHHSEWKFHVYWRQVSCWTKVSRCKRLLELLVCIRACVSGRVLRGAVSRVKMHVCTRARIYELNGCCG
jgi:hypothetical protein